MKQNDLVFIQDQIGYVFNNSNLLKQAFTRRSYSEENGGENNEVLEFIGDKVLDLIVTKYLTTQNSNSTGLFKKFDPKLKNTWAYEIEKKTFPFEDVFISDYSESELTEIRKLLVQKKTLANRIDELGIGYCIIMGSGDVKQNIANENSVKEDLFEAILGAIAIDSDWNMDALQNAVEVMLAPECILADSDVDDYVTLIQEWSYIKTNSIPLYHFEKCNHTYSYKIFDGISQNVGLDDDLANKTKYHCFLKLDNELPVFRGFGQSQTEARKNVCKTAYEYLCKNDLWLSIRDEIENPNKDDAINQLEILARRDYFSIPTYDFKQTYDKDGNPSWECICNIAEESKTFSAISSSKKDAKKTAAYKMLQHVLKF